MSDTCNPTPDPDAPMIYQIRLKGALGQQWTGWFEGLSILLEENGDTCLVGPVADQAALHGLLRKVRDLGMPLVSVCCVGPGQADAPDVDDTHRDSSNRQQELITNKAKEAKG